MADLLIRDVPEDVVSALDAQARHLGLSRSEYLRRRLARDAALPDDGVTVQDLAYRSDVRCEQLAGWMTYDARQRHDCLMSATCHGR